MLSRTCVLGFFVLFIACAPSAMRKVGEWPHDSQSETTALLATALPVSAGILLVQRSDTYEPRLTRFRVLRVEGDTIAVHSELANGVTPQSLFADLTGALYLEVSLFDEATGEHGAVLAFRDGAWVELFRVPDNESLLAAGAAATDDIWVTTAPRDSESLAAISHWNGVTLSSNRDARVQALGAHVVRVGSANDVMFFRVAAPNALRWDGGSLVSVPLPTDADARDVQRIGDAWLLGTDRGFRRFDGTAFVPVLSSSDVAILSFLGRSEADVWAMTLPSTWDGAAARAVSLVHFQGERRASWLPPDADSATWSHLAVSGARAFYWDDSALFSVP